MDKSYQEEINKINFAWGALFFAIIATIFALCLIFIADKMDERACREDMVSKNAKSIEDAFTICSGVITK